ncbi:uncharacterized protein THITE_2073219 [Thermothielavioides terrestris NRRL 8126]|uniref:Uncharacterized protein n=1 Tax=Thermothielavioides terrestris (strain ATCC 38088 / NRRL 8126) TaxID=578455 RepID=G2QQZ3_THETT|nr:uncharacterized protein THITE_2073219 [Thermothielavioides terrestris NRRL 8126]AEO62445.1 hypothetical protein THITE_2073219 [Thermothielavioides terrestris NRRL 8126]
MLVKAMLVKTQARRVLGRPRSLLPAILVFLVVCWLGLVHHDSVNQRLAFEGRPQSLDRDPDERRDRELQAQRRLFEEEHRQLEKKPGLGAIYGQTLETLVDNHTRTEEQEARLGSSNATISSKPQPVTFNPYPKYNSPEWNEHHAPYVPCVGPTGRIVEDIRVYKGLPRDFPKPGFGSYSVLGLDGTLCFERETRLGQYGLSPLMDKNGQEINWDNVRWGDLQESCLERNRARFARSGPKNTYVNQDVDSSADLKRDATPGSIKHPLGRLWRRSSPQASKWLRDEPSAGADQSDESNNATAKYEPRTALLLRSFSGKTYTENDKQVIRSLITELSLRTGGEYQVFLFVHIRENDRDITAEEAYQKAVEEHVPAEFRSIALLWNEPAVDLQYPALTEKARRVHNGQFLSVQMFMQEYREFDFVWNWEMDSRVIGQHYDVLTRLGEWARKQPRRGIWERNERFYIPSVHGDYDTQFRASVEAAVGGETIWGAPDVPVVKPLGPKPPVATAAEDNYEWGVGEEADLIELAPLFNPVNSGWVMRNQVWGYRSRTFPWGKLPRRATIVTQSRLSRRLLDVMHTEDMRGNHVASEMVAQTTALLHGFKAVYAPMPVFFDRAWSGEQLAKWFNGGPNGQSGSFGSAMGWGQEGRYLGSTWYYRALPPQRLYNNWMGYEDTGIGGADWEAEHGRPCLPAMILHPIKEIKPTEKGYSTDSRLPYD